jgi:hypothetical protein
MRKEFPYILANVELISGSSLGLFSLWLMFRFESNWPSMTSYVALELLIYSMIVISCGATLKFIAHLKMVSQCIFAIATLFIYVDLCTSYAGWYLYL